MISYNILCLTPPSMEGRKQYDLPGSIGGDRCIYHPLEGTWNEAIEHIKESDVKYNLILMHLEKKDLSVENIQVFFKNLPKNIKVIGTGLFDDLTFYRNLRNLGFYDYLPEPFTLQTMEFALAKSFGIKDLNPNFSLTSHGKKIAIISSRGGVGATTLSANIAGTLRENFEEKVGLVEFSKMKRDLSYFFGSPPNNSIYDFGETTSELQDVGGLSSEVAEKISLFSSKLSITNGLKASFFENMQTYLDLIAETHNSVIIDLSNLEDDFLIEHFAHLVDYFIIVVDNSVSSIAHANTICASILEIDMRKICIASMGNGPFKEGGISKEQIKKNIKHSYYINLPFDEKKGLKALNTGTLLINLDTHYKKIILEFLDILGWYQKKEQSLVQRVKKIFFGGKSK